MSSLDHIRVDGIQEIKTSPDGARRAVSFPQADGVAKKKRNKPNQKGANP